jgi:hypothetical protein
MFAEDVYAPALLKGDRLGAAREREVAEQLSAFIGLPVEHILEKHLRIDLTDFRANLLRREGKACGRLDMRFVSDAPSYLQVSSTWLAGEDASDDAVDGVWTSAFRAFCSDVLGYDGPARYVGSNYQKIGPVWKWAHEMPGCDEEAAAPNMALDIAVALRRDPTIKLAILGGRYDAATPWWNVEHDMASQFLSPQIKARISWYRYGCGQRYVSGVTSKGPQTPETSASETSAPEVTDLRPRPETQRAPPQPPERKNHGTSKASPKSYLYWDNGSCYRFGSGVVPGLRHPQEGGEGGVHRNCNNH